MDGWMDWGESLEKQSSGWPWLDCSYLTRHVCNVCNDITKTKHTHRYLRALEEVVIRAMRPLGVEGGREEGLTGVWTSKGKVAVSGCLLLEPVDRCVICTINLYTTNRT